MTPKQRTSFLAHMKAKNDAYLASLPQEERDRRDRAESEYQRLWRLLESVRQHFGNTAAQWDIAHPVALEDMRETRRLLREVDAGFATMEAEMVAKFSGAEPT